MSEAHLTDLEFATLPLQTSLQQGLQSAGFQRCTPIQADSLPTMLAGNDVAGQAQTGTGKSAAFLLATMQKLLTVAAAKDRKPTSPRALILAPTRELAVQIHRDAEMLGQHSRLRLGLAYGGTGYQSQRETIQNGVDILIGTPGRLIDYFKQKVFDLKAINVVVLDEADRMFDLGFISDVRYLLRRMPKPESRLNLLFSATLSSRVMELAYEHMNDPQLIKVSAGDRIVVDNVSEKVYYPATDEKIPLLLGLLQQGDPKRSLVFTNTKRAGENVHRWLNANGISAGLLTGDVPQRKRESLLAQFSAGKIDVLVATDVAARGLHIPSVSHVFNFDLPFDAEDYVHRIGRTARAGASGDAISFACEEYAYSLGDIEEYVGHLLPRGDINDELLVDAEKPPYAPRKKANQRQRDHSRRRKTQTGKPRSRGKTQANKGVKAKENHPAARNEKQPRTKPAKPSDKPEAPKRKTSKKNPAQLSKSPAPRRKKSPAKSSKPNVDVPVIG